MFGEITEEGLVSKGSSDYVMLVHKDSTGISKSKHPNFQLELNRLEPYIYYQYQSISIVVEHVRYEKLETD